MSFLGLFKKSPKKQPDSIHQVSAANKRQPPMPFNAQNARPASGNNPRNDPMSELVRNIAQNSTDGSGVRLVLGEGMTPMSEALQNGGRYILVHPEVIRKLEGNGIDSFLIYEAALRTELESRIPQIDFVSGDVTKLMQEAQGNLDRQTPMHVRQLLWLKENAGQYGYQQCENGWKLQSAV